MFVVVGITAMNEVNEPALVHLGAVLECLLLNKLLCGPRTGVMLPDPSLVWRLGSARAPLFRMHFAA